MVCNEFNIDRPRKSHGAVIFTARHDLCYCSVRSSVHLSVVATYW